MNDAEIIKNVKQGQVDDFSLLVERYHRQLLSFIHKITLDPALTEDIGQDVFLCIYRSLAGFDEDAGTPFSAWLFITARNKAISAVRSRNRRRFAGPDALAELRDARPGPVEKLIMEQERRALADCLGQLEEPYRTALLRSLTGDSIGEIARLESVAAGTIKSRIHRARKKLGFLVRNLLHGEQYD